MNFYKHVSNFTWDKYKIGALQMRKTFGLVKILRAIKKRIKKLIKKKTKKASLGLPHYNISMDLLCICSTQILNLPTVTFLFFDSDLKTAQSASV